MHFPAVTPGTAPGGTIFLLPFAPEQCDAPRRLATKQSVQKDRNTHHVRILRGCTRCQGLRHSRSLHPTSPVHTGITRGALRLRECRRYEPVDRFLIATTTAGFRCNSPMGGTRTSRIYFESTQHPTSVVVDTMFVQSDYNIVWNEIGNRNSR